MPKYRNLLIASTACLFSLAAVAQAPAPTTLKDAFHGGFVVGAAINTAQITGKDVEGDKLIVEQFNSISPENVMKWEVIHPKPDAYDFTMADKYVDFGIKHHLFIVGHTLCWHAQTPAWVFKDDKGNPITRDALLQRLHDHIATVVGRYKGKIGSWDVVNEALNEDGTLRQSPWMKIIGEDYIVKAFQYTHEADPSVQLTYNDYNLETPAKRKGAIEIVKKLKAAGVPVAIVGNQAHLHLDGATAADEDAMVTELAAAGVKVAITELDIDVLPSAWGHTADVSLNIKENPKLNPYPNGLPEDVQQQLAKRYADLFAVWWKHRDAVTRVTLWGVTDAGSWLNNWPVRGRTSYPLLFDREGKPKLAFKEVAAVPAR
ncbi:endo-1,4-beta-xylanase [Occallatibacter riparius]|uniref:Beta-xylanase n=1 Tax=Occallatibacter riparius TaxID=1002689 RepID=A0A9J7BP46_9BACT|nr:endo-1,4-beta-xylanase [Occallatibacter riparius]UWZ84488.1 endo-1,4-beta-xylanase [Occallatibacter riparius]